MAFQKSALKLKKQGRKRQKNQMNDPINYDVLRNIQKPNYYQIENDVHQKLEELNVFDKNYNYAKFYKMNRDNMESELYSPEKNEPILKGKNKTDELMNEVLRDCFSKLFNELDANQESVLSPLSINLKNTDKVILDIDGLYALAYMTV